MARKSLRDSLVKFLDMPLFQLLACSEEELTIELDQREAELAQVGQQAETTSTALNQDDEA